MIGLPVLLSKGFRFVSAGIHFDKARDVLLLGVVLLLSVKDEHLLCLMHTLSNETCSLGSSVLCMCQQPRSNFYPKRRSEWQPPCSRCTAKSDNIRKASWPEERTGVRDSTTNQFLLLQHLNQHVYKLMQQLQQQYSSSLGRRRSRIRRIHLTRTRSDTKASYHRPNNAI